MRQTVFLTGVSQFETPDGYGKRAGIDFYLINGRFPMQSLGNLFGCNRLDHIWKDKESNNADDYRKNDDDGENFFAIFMFTGSFFIKNSWPMRRKSFSVWTKMRHDVHRP